MKEPTPYYILLIRMMDAATKLTHRRAAVLGMHFERAMQLRELRLSRVK